MKRIATLLLFLSSLTFFGQEPLKVEKIERISFSESEPTPPTIVSLEQNASGGGLTARPASGGTADGATAGSLSVSATGAAIYSIPIAAPPGLQGIAPTLSINYNSQAGNGMAGYGWNVSGISVISRVGSTLYHDGAISEVNLTPSDRFSLDGQRLMLKTGQYGKDGATYQTEVFSHLKIKSVGVSSYGADYGPLYFEVLYPDGSKAYYGQTDDSRSHTDYAISYWENPQGIRITYHYRRSGNAIAIDRITYGKQHTVGDNTISFVYKNRTRPEVAYVGGIRFENNLLLERIVASAKGQEFRTYNLEYGGMQNSLGYDRLMSVQESVGFSKREPIRFSYQDSANNFHKTKSEFKINSIGNLSRENSDVVPLDFNGDHLTDFILYPTRGENAYKKVYLFDNFRNRTEEFYTFSVLIDKFSKIFPTQILLDKNKIFADFQGFTAISEHSNKLKFKTYIKGSFSPIQLWNEKEWELPIYYERNRDWCYNTQNRVPRTHEDYEYFFRGEPKHIPVTTLSGDFNGDGSTDILAIEQPYFIESCTQRPKNDIYIPDYIFPPTTDDLNNECDCESISAGGSFVHWIDMNKQENSNFSRNVGHLSKDFTHRDILQSIDITGNGKTNLIQITNGRIYIYEFNKNNFLKLLWEQSHPNIKTDEKRPLTGDYNGDGKIDFLLPKGNNSNRFVLLSNTGKGFDVSENSYEFYFREHHIETKYRLFTFYKLHHHYSLLPIDVNGDGKTDIVSSHSIHSSSKHYKNGESHSLSVFANMGGSTPTFKKVKDENLSPLEKLPHLLFLGSNNRRETFMDISIISSNQINTLLLEHNNKVDMQLIGTLQNNIQHNIFYKPMVMTNFFYNYNNREGMDVYQKEYGEQFPYIDLAGNPLQFLIYKIERQGGGIPSAEQQFKYAGAVSHHSGLGFIGFKSVGKTNWYTKGKAHEEALYTHTRMNPQLRGAVTDEFTSEQIGNYGTREPYSYIQKTAYTYENLTTNDKIFKLKLTQKSTEDKLNGVNTSQSFTYDENMNPTRVVTTAGTSQNTVETTYAPTSQSPYLVGRVASQRTSSTIDGDTFTSEEQFTYQNNLVTAKKIKGHNTQFKTERYTYDDVGNITRKETVSENGETRSEQMEYDPSKRFLTKHTDFEGQETLYQHDSRNGNLQQETNPFRQTTRYSYDAWGRLERTSDFLNKNTTISYISTNNEYSVTISGDDGSLSKEVYNWLGLLKQSEKRNAFGQNVIVENQYDGQGRNIRKSLPYFQGKSPQGWTETHYDLYGRISRTVHPTGKTIQISYNGLTTTVNDGSKTISTTRNATGQIVSHQDPGGTVTYTYFGNGNLKSADYQGITQRITQNGWGQKTNLNDPSAGNYTYAYDGWGRLTRETSPNGSTTYAYENTSDRIREKHITGSGTDMRTTYTYNNDKLLSTIQLQSSDEYSETYTYTYNSYKQLASLVESKANGAITFSRHYWYDDFGRTNRETYVSNAFGKNITANVLYQYNNGELSSLKKASGEILWQLNSTNEYNLPLDFVKGKVTEQLQYDYHYLTSHSVRGTNTIIDDKVFQFDRIKGLLNHRTYSFNENKESFEYDNLERLTSWKQANQPAQTQRYDTRGRIEQNSGLGQYAYQNNSYRQSQLNTNEAGNAHYTQHSVPTVRYNAFKSPVEIRVDSPQNKDIISYQYDAFGSRATAYYGGTQADKTQRRFQKYYSHDGIFEVKHDRTTNKTNFYIYLGGDAYSAPAVYCVENNTEKYLYLHRDYLRSITLITDDEGNAVEKRHFDAWGQLTKYRNAQGQTTPPAEGILLDRGYTGHEHLFSVGLIHMNGRLYDPALHRFLQPDNYVQDPFNTQNFNRYGYVLNNPLMYTDPSGEIVWAPIIIGAIIGAVSYTTSAIINDSWSWKGFGLSVLGGAVMGYGSSALGVASAATLTSKVVFNAVATGVASAVMPSINIPIGDWNFSLSLSVAFGNASGIGASIGIGYSDGNWSFSAGVGIMSYGNYNGFGKNGFEVRKSILAAWDDGKMGVSLGTNFWSGDFEQRTGMIGFRHGDFSVMYENDGGFGIKNLGLGDRGDSYRTAALNIGIGDFTAGFNLFTGYRGLDNQEHEGKIENSKGKLVNPVVNMIDEKGRKFKYGFVNETGEKYRLGALTIGYKGWRVGTNSEHVRHAIQNRFIHNLIGDRGFENQSWDWKYYYQYRTPNKFTSW